MQIIQKLTHKTHDLKTVFGCHTETNVFEPRRMAFSLKNLHVAPYFRNQLLKEMWHFGSFRVCSRARMSLALSETPRSNGFDAHSQWGLRQMAVGLLRKL